jgi:hypothetical protein
MARSWRRPNLITRADIRRLIYAAAKGAERDGDLSGGRQLRAMAYRMRCLDRYPYPLACQHQNTKGS